MRGGGSFTFMDDLEAAPACPSCKRQMKLTAQLPPTTNLPGLLGYRCDDCENEVAVEVE